MPLDFDADETMFPDQGYNPSYYDLLYTLTPPPEQVNNRLPTPPAEQVIINQLPSPPPMLHTFLRQATPEQNKVSEQISPPKLVEGLRKSNARKPNPYIYTNTGKSAISYYPMVAINGKPIYLGSYASISSAKTIQYLCCQLLAIVFPTSTLRPTALFEQKYSAQQLKRAKDVLINSTKLYRVTGIRLKESDFDAFVPSFEATAADSTPRKKLRI